MDVKEKSEVYFDAMATTYEEEFVTSDYKKNYITFIVTAKA